MDHVAFGEDGAAPGDAGGVAGAADEAADFLDRVLHAEGLLVEEGAGAGGAFAGAVVVHDAALLQADVFGAFAADLKDRADVRIEGADHARDSFELVFEEEPENFGDRPAARSGYANAFDTGFGDDVVEFLQEIVGGLYGAARDAAVLGKHQRQFASSRAVHSMRRKPGSRHSAPPGKHGPLAYLWQRA